MIDILVGAGIMVFGIVIGWALAISALGAGKEKE